MKHGKNPTLRQKEYIYAHEYIPDHWLVLQDTAEKMVLVHKWVRRGEQRRTVTIEKGANA